MSAHSRPAIIEVTPDNLEQEHICCAISATPDSRACAAAKKAWMQARFADGYRFIKLDVRGKVFLEVIPGQHAWAPISADNWLFIDCFWVSGQYAGKGYARQLFDYALHLAKEGGYNGLVAVSADQKLPFLSNPAFYEHLGFKVADTAAPYYRLYIYSFSSNNSSIFPSFLEVAKKPPAVPEEGFALYYSDHCPHTSKYVPLLAQEAATVDTQFHITKIDTCHDARKTPNPFPTFALFFNGKLLGNEIYSPAKLRKLVQSQEGKGK